MVSDRNPNVGTATLRKLRLLHNVPKPRMMRCPRPNASFILPTFLDIRRGSSGNGGCDRPWPQSAITKLLNERSYCPDMAASDHAITSHASSSSVEAAVGSFYRIFWDHRLRYPRSSLSMGRAVSLCNRCSTICRARLASTWKLPIAAVDSRGTLPSNHDMARVNVSNGWKFQWLEQSDCVRFP